MLKRWDKNGAGMQIVCGDFNIDLLNDYLAAQITLENLMTAQGLDLVSSVYSSIYSIYSSIPLQLTRIKKLRSRIITASNWLQNIL